MMVDQPMNNVPHDWEKPNFSDRSTWSKCHEWKWYVDSEVEEIWTMFSDQAKQVLAQNFQGIADNEEWD